MLLIQCVCGVEFQRVVYYLFNGLPGLRSMQLSLNLWATFYFNYLSTVTSYDVQLNQLIFRNNGPVPGFYYGLVEEISICVLACI